MARAWAQIGTSSGLWQSETWVQATDSVYWFGRTDSLLSRILNHPYALAVRLLVRRHRHEVIVTVGGRTSVAYWLLCRLFGMAPSQIAVQVYRYERQGALAALENYLISRMLRSARGIIVPSRGEIELYAAIWGVDPDRVRFVPYHTNVLEPVDHGTSGNLVLSAGYQARDFLTLVHAVEGLDARVVIVAGPGALEDVELPPNVEVLRDVPYREYSELLRKAAIVVVPLVNSTIPAGQIVILEAMSYGKAVVTTRSVGTVDYVDDGVDGLLYQVRDPMDLREKLERLLYDDETRSAIGRAGFRRVEARYSFDSHGAALIAAIQSLMAVSAS